MSAYGYPRFLRRLTAVSAEAWNNARLKGSPSCSGRSCFKRRTSRMESTPSMSALATHQRVDHRVHVSALAVQQQQPDDVATELELVEKSLFAEAEQADREGTREPAGIGRPDRLAQGVVVDGVIALEGKPADHPLLLLLRGEGSRREHGDEQGQTERAQLTQWGCIPMLATSPRTVNLFDT